MLEKTQEEFFKVLGKTQRELTAENYIQLIHILARRSFNGFLVNLELYDDIENLYEYILRAVLELEDKTWVDEVRKLLNDTWCSEVAS